MNRLFEVKVYEPERRLDVGEYELDNWFNHPARYRYANYCLCMSCPEGKILRLPGGEGKFWFDSNGHCPRLGGMEHPAWIVGEIDPSRWDEEDRFELA